LPGANDLESGVSEQRSASPACARSASTKPLLLVNHLIEDKGIGLSAAINAWKSAS